MKAGQCSESEFRNVSVILLRRCCWLRNLWRSCTTRSPCCTSSSLRWSSRLWFRGIRSFVRCYMVVSNDVVYWNKLLVFVGFVKLGSFICQTQCGVSKFGWGYFAKGKKFASLFPNSQNNDWMGINSSLALFKKKKSYTSCMNNSQGRVNTQQVFGLSNSDLVPGKYEGGYFLFCSLHFCLFIRSEFGKPFSRIRKHQNWVLESKLSLGAFELTIFQTHSFILILLMSNQLQIWFPLS